MTIPVIRVRGSSAQCGRSYGEQTKDRIQISLEAYGRIFAHYAHWTWAEVTEEALRYVDAISTFAPEQITEMEAIADGAGVDFTDILAINVRTEIVFAAKARTLGASIPRFGECSSFAIVGDDDRTYIGQNWDWATHAFETVVRLEVIPESGPSYVTIVEAGLLCKFGMNSAGLGLACNALVSTMDCGEPGIPFHVMLRALISATNLTDAFALIQGGVRSSSANYMVAHASGLASDFECEAGDLTRVSILQSEQRGVLLHTNHFLAPTVGFDVGRWNFPDSPFRLQRLERAVRRALDVAPPTWFVEVAQDHAGHPSGVCCHPDESLPLEEQGATIVSTIMDLGLGTMSVWNGNPCSVPRIDIDYGQLWRDQI